MLISKQLLQAIAVAVSLATTTTGCDKIEDDTTTTIEEGQNEQCDPKDEDGSCNCPACGMG